MLEEAEVEVEKQKQTAATTTTTTTTTTNNNRQTYIKRVKFLAVDETCKAIFQHVPGPERRKFSSSGFYAEERFNFWALSVSLRNDAKE